MEIALHRIVGGIEPAYVGIGAVVERLAPVARSVEIAVLRAVLNTGMVPHLADVYLAALGPNHPALFRQLRHLGVYVVVVP